MLDSPENNEKEFNLVFIQVLHVELQSLFSHYKSHSATDKKIRKFVSQCFTVCPHISDTLLTFSKL